MSGLKFTAAQLAATAVSGRQLDSCVVAGPGSGKTTVLVEYFRRLVGGGVDPLRILAITFTEKAAANMRKKVADAFRENPQIRARLERAWISTVHGFCARLLRENAVFAGVDPQFHVADERESWRMQEASIAAALEELFQEKPDAVRALIRALSSPEFEEAVLAAYDAMRGAGVRVTRLAEYARPLGTGTAEIAQTLAALRRESLSAWNYAQKEQFQEAMEGAARIAAAPSTCDALMAVQAFSCNLRKCKQGTNAYSLLQRLKELVEQARYSLITDCYAAERMLLLDVFHRFDRIYRDRKRDAAALDFADLEEYTVELLAHYPETRARVQNQFDHILMDELQDTNGQQTKLLAHIRRPDRFYAVGDVNQSIFGFRHAEPEGFLEYRVHVEKTGGRVVELIENFRSRPEILSAVETITASAPGILRRKLVAGRLFRRLRPLPIEVIGVAGDEAREAQWVGRRIRELLEGEPEFSYQDIAVLVRNTEVLGDFTSAFDGAGIPYVVNRGRGFYDTREVNDLTHLLRVIANPRDEISMAVVLRSPLVGVSDEALLRLRLLGANIGAALSGLTDEAATEFHADDAHTLLRFRANLHTWRMRREQVTFDRLLLDAVDECGYPWTPNIDKFLAQARDAGAGMSLDEFLEEVALVRAKNPREPDAPPDDSANAVKIMTVHSAKGLEFPIVFVAAIHKGIKSDLPVVAFSRNHGLGARWRIPGGREEKDDLFQHAIREERKQRELEESNRLLYVAMTRAEQHLVLSFCTNGRKPANWAATVASSLQLDLDSFRDETLVRRAPDGKEFQIRVLLTDQPPAPLSAYNLVPASAPPTATVPPPRITEQYDTNAAVTDLAVFAKCPRKYYLSRYLAIDAGQRSDGGAEAVGDLAASELGSQVHALLAGVPVEGAAPEALRLAAVFRESLLGRRAVRAQRLEREFAFLMAVDDLVLRGQVDLWFEEGGELVIVDYKTDAVSAAEARERAHDYALQLRLYAMAVARVAGRAPSRACLHFLRPNTVIDVDLRPSLWDAPEQVVREFEEAQSNAEFPLNEGAHCRRCAYFRNLCPAGA